MPFSRNQVCSEMLSFYDFLVSMYLPEDAVKRPPPDGWPGITFERFSKLKDDKFSARTETVIDLLKHLPYLRQRRQLDEPYELYEHTYCIDYSGEFLNHLEQYPADGRDRLMPPPGFLVDSPLSEEIWATDHGQMVAIALPLPSDMGFSIILDTEKGTVFMLDQGPKDRDFADVSKFLEFLKEEFRQLRVIPFPLHEVREPSKTDPWPEMTQVQEAFRACGWPSDKFRKAECVARIAEICKDV